MHETQRSVTMHWDDPEGWDGEGSERWRTYVQPQPIHISVWEKPLQYYKVISLQLINLQKKKGHGNKDEENHNSQSES